MSFTPSPEQESILSAFNSTPDPLLIRAGAGTGKTATMCLMIQTLKSSASPLAVAFNKRIANELAAKIPTAECRTLNSLGFLFLRSQIQFKKLDPKAKSKEIRSQTKLSWKVCPDLPKFLGLAKSHMLTETSSDSELEPLTDIYDVDLGSATLDDLRKALKVSLDLAFSSGFIDYDDQIYLPARFGVGPVAYTHIFVDEAQDLNPMQHKLIERLCRSATKPRLIIVGDPDQAIYGFRGAMSESIPEFKSKFNLKELPLRTTFRCPKAIVKEANRYVTDYFAHDSAPEGQVFHDGYYKLSDIASELSTTVLCRYNKPLITLAFGLIESGIPARVLGRDIETGLKTLSKKVGLKGNAESFRSRLREYLARESSKLLSKDKEGAAATLTDRCGCLAVVSRQVSESSDIPRAIETIFEGKQNSVELSSIHKSKGLEWQRVFWLDPQNMPSKYATQPWELRQESNLAYVCITRSQNELHFLRQDHIE